jgi:cell division protein FtsB
MTSDVPAPSRLRSARAEQRGGGGRGRRVGRALWPVLATLALVLVLFTAVFPTRTFLSQRAATASAQERLSVLREQSEALEDRAELLQDDEEVERKAREEYNLVMPGEEAYAMLPSAAPPPTAPVAPEGEPDDRNPLERLWDGITGIL